MNRSLLEMISQCPTAYHTVRWVKNKLQKAGFAPLPEQRDSLKPGGKYYLEKNQSTLLAFVLPKEAPTGFLIVAAHGDSPSFKLKHNCFLEKAGHLMLNTERYGGMDLSSWLDLPLALAGRVILQERGRLRSVLADSRKPVCLIPSVAGHLMKEKGALDVKTDLVPLYGGGNRRELFSLLGVDPAAVMGWDLYLYNPALGLVWGGEEEFVSAPRLDDLQCVFAATEAFLQADSTSAVPLLCVFDNEEVGSGTKQGADSRLLCSLIERIACEGKLEAWERQQLLSSSFALSADNAHALHPNHPELSDPADRPLLNGGVVLKFNANNRYTTDALSCALVKQLAQKAGVSLQFYSNRSDLPGGSTLGNLLVRHLPIDCADIGAPQLSMHSTFETAGSKDTEALFSLMKCFFSSRLRSVEGMLQFSE